MPTSTTNYGMDKPLVNSATDQDLYGYQINGDIDDIDSLFVSAIKFVKSSKTISFSVTAPTAGTATVGDSKKLFLCDATSGSISALLPSAASAGDGFTIALKKTDSSVNAITITPNGSEKIDGNSTYPIASSIS